MIIVEYIKNGYTHSEVNASMISIYKSIFKEECIHLFCAREHYEIIINLLVKNNVSVENIIYHEITTISDFVREYKLLFSDFNIVRNVFNFAKKNNDNKIIFLYTTTFMLYFTKLYCLFNPAIKVISTIHSELEKVDVVEYAKSFSKNKILMFMYALFFGLKFPLTIPTPKNLNYLVYGESIIENIKNIVPSLKNKFIAIPHPYLYKEVSENKTPNIEKINFGVVGICAKRKNTPYLTRLINHLSKLDKNNFKLCFSGKIIDDKFFELVSKIDWVNRNSISKTMIDSSIRNKIIKNNDYILYTYQPGSYKYIASGVFFDCVNYEKPIIALKTDYIVHYFKKYGNIGYLCNSYEELERKVDEILESVPIEEYQEQVSNLRSIKENESLKNIALDLDEQLKMIKFKG